jgi:CRISPR-associated exonuclease Cas4
VKFSYLKPHSAYGTKIPKKELHKGFRLLRLEYKMISEKRIDQLLQEMQIRYINVRKKLRVKFKKQGKKLLFVHELCECSFKRTMRARFPDVEKAQTFNSRFVIGQLIEEALKHRFEDVDEHAFTKEVTIDDECIVVSGMVDIIEPKTSMPIEVKYLTSLESVPREHHVLQLQIYLWLVSKAKGELTYVSPQGVKSYSVNTPLTDEEIIQLIREEKTPRWEWECGYCEYKQFCNKAKDVKPKNWVILGMSKKAKTSRFQQENPENALIQV